MPQKHKALGLWKTPDPHPALRATFSLKGRRGAGAETIVGA
jgi:hypothetical protein